MAGKRNNNSSNNGMAPNERNVRKQQRSPNRRRKRGRQVWAVEGSNVRLTNKILYDLERYFVRRVCESEDHTLISKRIVKGAVYLEFRTRAQWQAALNLGGSNFCGCQIKIRQSLIKEAAENDTDQETTDDGEEQFQAEQNTNSQLQVQVDRLTKEISRIREREVTISASMVELSKENEDLSTRLKNAESSSATVESQKTELSRKLNDVSLEKESLDTKLKDAEALCRQKEQLIRILNHNIQMAEERIQTLQNESKSSAERAEQLFKSRSKEKDDKIDTLTKQVVSLKQDEAARDAEKSNLEDLLKAERTMNEPLRTQVQDLLKDIDFITERELLSSAAMTKLSKENDELTIRLKNVKSSNFVIEKDRLDHKVKTLEKENKSLKYELESSYHSERKVRQAVRQFQEDAMTANAELEKDEAWFRRKLKSLQTENEDLRYELEASHHSERRLKEDVRELEKDVTSFRRDLKDLKTENDDLKYQFEKDGRKLKTLQTENEDLAYGLETSRRSERKLREDARQLESSNAVLEKDLEETKRKLKTLETEKKQLEYQAQVTHNSNRELKKAMSKLEEEKRSISGSNEMQKAHRQGPSIKSEEGHQSQTKKEEGHDESASELKSKLYTALEDQNKLLEENRQLRRDKQDMQRTISSLEACAEENEQLREEIEQIRMNQALEAGFMEGSSDL